MYILFSHSCHSLYPNLLMPDFSGICVNIMFVSNLINEYVLYFNSCSLINNCFPYLWLLPSNDITKRSMNVPAFSLFYLYSALLKTSLLDTSGNILITSYKSCIVFISSYSLIDTTDLSINYYFCCILCIYISF